MIRNQETQKPSLLHTLYQGLLKLKTLGKKVVELVWICHGCGASCDLIGQRAVQCVYKACATAESCAKTMAVNQVIIAFPKTPPNVVYDYPESTN